MAYFEPNNKLPVRLLALLLAAVAVFGAFMPAAVSAHMQPTTMMLLDVGSENIRVELQIPLSELELAFGHNVTKTDIENWRGDLSSYIVSHFRPVSGERPWTVNVDDMALSSAVQTQSGLYQEVIVHLDMSPPAGADVRQFTLNYDLIMHQVVTHRALVFIRKDWERGQNGEDTISVGLIQVDTTTTKIFPLDVSLEKGGFWQGFAGMFKLGMQHIKAGTDHLLFLLVLLLPAPLLFDRGRWVDFGGTSYSVSRLLKIVTAFTIGHSLTLIVGSLGILRLPQQPVEILIAVSILVSAIHAVRPLFPGREMFVAAGFGLVHGLAFATVLSNLNLEAGQMAISILGFNLGIEAMQLVVTAVAVPWLIILALTPVYRFVRVAGAGLAGAAALGWIAERVSGVENIIGQLAQGLSAYGHFW